MRYTSNTACQLDPTLLSVLSDQTLIKYRECKKQLHNVCSFPSNRFSVTDFVLLLKGECHSDGDCNGFRCDLVHHVCLVPLYQRELNFLSCFFASVDKSVSL